MKDINQNIFQEGFLNDTLIMAGFDPNVDDFFTLKEEMRPILEEFIELRLYNLLDDQDKSIYDKFDYYNFDFFTDKIQDFDEILSNLYIEWQNNYIKYMTEEDD